MNVGKRKIMKNDEKEFVGTQCHAFDCQPLISIPYTTLSTNSNITLPPRSSAQQDLYVTVSSGWYLASIGSNSISTSLLVVASNVASCGQNSSNDPRYALVGRTK